MKMDKLDLLKTSLALSMLIALSACGAAGGGSGGLGSGGTNRASGVLALPSATCGANACVSSASALGTLSTDSSAILLDNAEFGYAYINSTFVPMVNEKMYQLEEAFKSNDLDQCGVSSVDPLVQRRQINLVPDATYQLNTTTSVVVTSAGLHTAPYTMEKKFVVSISGNPAVEVQVGCPSATERSLYVRVIDGANRFEAWGHQSTSEKVIYAASDIGAEKRTLYFKSTSNSVFEIAAIVKDASLDGGAPISVAISGGADLLSGNGKLEVNFLTTAASALTASTGATFDANDVAYGGSDKRHCYTSLSPISISTTASDCSSLFTGPGAAYLRGGVRALTDWSVSTLGSASISGTF